MSDKVALREDDIQEVFERASHAQAQINGLVKNTELEHEDFDDIIYNLEMIQRRVDPCHWRDDYDN